MQLVRGEKYSLEKKQEVVELLLMHENMRKASEISGVPLGTVMAWKKQDWFRDMAAEIRTQERAELDTKMKRIIDKSLNIVEDRLENGEIILNNKTGELVRKPVGLRDSSRAASELIAKRIAIEQSSEEVQIRKDSMADTLKMLAGEFAKWAGKDNKSKTIDVEDAVIVEEKRST